MFDTYSSTNVPEQASATGTGQLFKIKTFLLIKKKKKKPTHTFLIMTNRLAENT